MIIDFKHEARRPKRGDLLHTNVGDRRERTWLILRVHHIRKWHKSGCAFYRLLADRDRREDLHSFKMRVCDCGLVQAMFRYKLWAARWWELEPEMRMKLYRSAERNGGQRLIIFEREQKKSTKRREFEQYVRRELPDLGIRAPKQ